MYLQFFAVQIEQFGVHTRNDGTICYGMQIESIMGREKHAVSLDHLARVLTDVHQVRIM